MDPFTQRMLERAKIRREKLNNHLAQELEQPQSGNNVEDKNDLCVGVADVNNLKEKAVKDDHSNTRKIKLQKLAKFYAGEKDLSFEKENYENLELESSSPTKKPKCKLSRLAELTTKINQWEDEVGPPKASITSKSDKTEKINGDSTSENEKSKMWNPMVNNLCSQGYTLCETQSKLVYDFGKKPQNESENVNLTKSIKETSNIVSKPSVQHFQNKIEMSQKNENGLTHEKPVLSKVAFFESGNKNEIKKEEKDPAELSLAERKALFEQNLSNYAANIRFQRPAVTPKRDYEIQNKRICTTKNNIMSTKEEPPKDVETPEPEALESIVQPVTTSNACGNVTKKNTFTTEPLESNKTSENVKNEKTIPKILEPQQIPPVTKTCELMKTTENVEECSDFVSPSSGRLYPSLSNLDVSEVTSPTTSEADDLNQSKNSNICLNMSLSDLLEMNKNNPITPPNELSFSKSKECQVLNKMDKLLENALNDLSSESEDENQEIYSTPPKIMKSSSFEYKGTNDKQPLLHTVSLYRKQQQSHFSPEKNESQPEVKEEESISVESKIEILLAEVNRQQTIMSQASQALNLCLSTVEFSGSGEQVEGERLLLLASHKRQACLNEIQRLKVENCLQPRGENLLSERGDVTLTNISVRLKRDALRAMAAAENLQYFVCLIKSDERVMATPAVPATRENLTDLNLEFPGSIKLEDLYSNFRVTIEVYSLELSKELLPHEVKYHICNKKEKKLLTPMKVKKMESKLIKPHIQSPAGPNAVRTTSFQMCGYVVFSLREVSRTQWMLNKVPYVSSLEGTLSMNINSQLRLEDEFRGFLTMFDDISGFGAWHRRWCLLSSHVISFWKYPDDEQKKVPIGTIDLRSVVTENVGVVSRDICARLNTFLLETTRPRLSEDKNSLVLKVQDDVTTIRHLLSADSKQEMLTWCKKLNTILALLRSWKCNFES